MMQNIGIDIIEIARIKKAVDLWGEVFLKRVYTRPELRLYSNKPSSLAARFSGKEAVIKILNAKGIGFKEVEILPDIEGKPRVKLYGRAQIQAEQQGFINIAISLSHCKEYAIACAVGETKN